MAEDVKDWKKKLTKSEKTFLTHIFRFFTQGDIDVAGAYVEKYLPQFPQPEVRMWLLSAAARETIHIAAYAHLVETLGLPETTYNEFMQYDAMKNKHEYLNAFESYPYEKMNVARDMAVFSAFTEGMQLFSSFIMLLNFTRHGKMKGMGQIISWSIVDETLHTETMIKLFRTYISENPEIWDDSNTYGDVLKGNIYGIAKAMVELEDAFIDLAFGLGPMEDLTADEVKQYIRYICDRRLIALGLKGIFKVKKNPLLWVESMINAPTHTNFFENKSTDYAKGALTGTWEDVWASNK